MKRLGVLWFSVIVMLILTSCGTSPTVPPAPTISVYLHFAPQRVALCSRSDGEKCPEIPIWETNNFIMLSPRDWQSVNDYIDALILTIEDPLIRQHVTSERDRLRKTIPSGL
jgi:hypothetical protein